jgi:hypothetical protein
MATQTSTEQRFPYTYKQVFEGLLVILPRIKAKIRSHDIDIGRIECSAGMSAFSFGENISISVEEIDSVSARVRISSNSKVVQRQALFSPEGKNQKNIAMIISTLSEYLKTQQKPQRIEKGLPTRAMTSATPPPPPSQFYIYVANEVKGPYTLSQLKALLDLRTIDSSTPCCHEGGENWIVVSDVLAG